MSTEFDSGGFSAVSSFFGGSAAADNQKSDNSASKPAPTSRKRSRLGLGAKEKDDENVLDALESEQTRKKILSVGKKKNSHYDGEAGSDNEATSDADMNRSDDEDEGGRTSIKKKEAIDNSFNVDIESHKQGKKAKKKKKKGKKERQAEKEKSELVEATNNDEVAKESLEISQGKSENSLSQTKVENEEKKDGAASKTDSNKRKKPKVRSRQKNIKKDNRPSYQKPEELRVGSKSYAGRPMTKETREFLALPESRTISRAKNKHQRFEEDDVANAPSSNFDEGLAVDDWLSESAVVEKEEIADSGEVVNQNQGVSLDSSTAEVKEPPMKKKKKNTKKKRTKFKNLK